VGLLATFTDQIQPPIKTQKDEKLAILNTYAFTINQVPHVFEEHYFAGYKHKYMEDFTERRFSTLICAKEQWRHPSTRLKPGKAPRGSNPGPAQSLSCEGGGETTRSWGGRPLGAGVPLPVLLNHPFDRRWHASMLRRCSPGFHAKNS